MAQPTEDAEHKQTIATDPAPIAASALSSAKRSSEQQQQKGQEQEQHRWRGRDVVFVDPLDSSAPYWWPAMIVPTDEIDASMGCASLGSGEYLVKYFEDFKYSTVNGSELRLFDTTKAPFTDFAANTPQFLKDKAIKSATSYLRSGVAHNKFRWRLWETGSETINLPFTIDTQSLLADAPQPTLTSEEDKQPLTDTTDTAEANADAGLAEESDDSTLFTTNPPDTEPIAAVPQVSANNEPSEDAADLPGNQNNHADDGRDAQQQDKRSSAGDAGDADAADNADGADNTEEASNAASTRSLLPQTRAAATESSVATTPAQTPLADNQQQQQSAGDAESPAPPSEEPTSATTAPSNGDVENGSEDDENEDEDEDANDNDNENEDDNDNNEDDDEPQSEQQQRQRQQQQQQTATPASTATARTTPETTTPPQQQQQPQPQPRARRTRPQRATANGSGTGRRGRPPLSSKQGGAAAKHRRNASSAIGANGSKRPASGPTIITDSMSALMDDPSADSAYAAESLEIQAIIKEMEEVQEEHRFFRSLVKKAAKDLWTQMGNEWPPNISGTSTRFGKRRKLA
ncbi:hypothetical protein FB645_001909 [Coemansia sp. IMI 203386]|nr:hypothetical protein FB645_001909 [Coemansia sp. IMI 203386]